MSDQETTETKDEAVAAEEEAAETEEGQEEEEFEFVEDPSFAVDYKGECAYEVQVTVPVANEQKLSAELLDKLQDDAELPGFRRGRAPRKLLQNKFGKAVRADATEKLVSAAFRKLIDDEELKPIALPDVDGLEEALERAEDAPLALTFKFEVAPRCELGTYRGVDVERPVLKVEDSDIAEVLDGMREHFALYETLDKGKAEEGDQVIINFEGVIDGEAFAGGSAENYPYILGSGRFFSEFEVALQGAEAGAKLSCDVEFPEDYGSAEVAGKTANFSIEAVEVKRKHLPELDDDFAKQAGEESAGTLREKVSTDLRKQSEEQGNAIAENRAIRSIVESSTFELPKSLIESSTKEYFEQEQRRLMNMRVPQAQIEEQEEKLRKDAEEAALRGIKGYVVVNEIGEAEGVEVNEEDFEQEAEAIQTRTGMDMDVISQFLQGEDRRDDYENRIFRRKTLAVVMENAEITDKVVTREELEKQDEEAES